MKAQVTIDYTDEKPVIDTILMSIQHDDDFDEAEFKKFVKENIMDAVVKKYDMNTDYRVLINPTGRFVIGGPHGERSLLIHMVDMHVMEEELSLEKIQQK